MSRLLFALPLTLPLALLVACGDEIAGTNVDYATTDATAERLLDQKGRFVADTSARKYLDSALKSPMSTYQPRLADSLTLQFDKADAQGAQAVALMDAKGAIVCLGTWRLSDKKVSLAWNSENVQNPDWCPVRSASYEVVITPKYLVIDEKAFVEYPNQSAGWLAFRR